MKNAMYGMITPQIALASCGRTNSASDIQRGQMEEKLDKPKKQKGGYLKSLQQAKRD